MIIITFNKNHTLHNISNICILFFSQNDITFQWRYFNCSKNRDFFFRKRPFFPQIEELCFPHNETDHKRNKELILILKIMRGNYKKIVNDCISFLSFQNFKMADYDDDNDYEEEFQEADEPEDFNEDLEPGDEQEQIDVLPAGEKY